MPNKDQISRVVLREHESSAGIASEKTSHMRIKNEKHKGGITQSLWDALRFLLLRDLVEAF